jgi:hypothetical protein
MFALNFYNDLYGDALKKGRKSATIRLGDKSAKYQTGQITWVTLGQRYARRKKLFCAILDAVEVKRCAELSPRDVQRENPEMRSKEEVMGLLAKIYGRDLTDDDIVTVIYFSPIDEYDL